MALLFSHWSNVKQIRLHYGKSSQDENFIFTNEVYINVKCVCVHTCMCAKLLQLCTTLCDPMDCIPPGSSVHGILQARKLEWLPCPPPGDLPNPGVKPIVSPALAGGLVFCLFVFTTRATWEACFGCISWQSTIYPGNVSLFSIWELTSIICHSKDLKKKNHLILSEDIENDFWPDSTSIPDNPPKNTKDRGTFFSLRKVVYTKQLLISWWWKIGYKENKASVPTLTTPVSIIL